MLVVGSVRLVVPLWSLGPSVDLAGPNPAFLVSRILAVLFRLGFLHGMHSIGGSIVVASSVLIASVVSATSSPSLVISISPSISPCY